MVFAKMAGKVVLASGVLALMAGCGDKDRMSRALQMKDEQIRRQEAELAEKEQTIGTLHTANKGLLDQNTKIVDNSAKTQQQLAATTSALNDLRGQMASLQGKLETANKGEVTVQESGFNKEPGAITIRVANSVLFDSGQATLKPQAYATLDKVAAELNGKFNANYIRVEGHTDRTPVVRNKDKFADNMQLSQARAKAVFDYLTGKGKVGSGRMYTAGFSYNQPVVSPETTAADRAKNRRVDIVILPTNVKVVKEHLASNR